jgi:integrase
MPRTSPIGIDGVSLSWLPDASGRVTRVRVKVRDQAGTYESQNFDIESWSKDGTPSLPLEAKRWASSKRGVFLAGQAVAGKALLTDALAAYCIDARARGIGEKYIVDVERTIVVATKEPGMADMQSPEFPACARRWLEASTSSHLHKDDNGQMVPTRKPLSPFTRNKRLQHLRTVVHHAVAMRWMPHDPLLGLKRFKVSKKGKAVFTLDEITKTMTAEAQAHTYFPRWALLIYGGFRVGEMLHLRWHDIDWGAGTIGVRLQPGVYALKRDKERTVPLQAELRAILRPLARPHGFIHPTEYQTNDNKVHQRAFDKFLVDCGIEVRDRTPHCTRHTWACLLLASGIATAVVKKWAGHSSLSTTEGYADHAADLEPSVRDWTRGEMRLMTSASPVAEQFGKVAGK